MEAKAVKRPRIKKHNAPKILSALLTGQEIMLGQWSVFL